MSGDVDSAIRIELALRGAQIAKCALELMTLSPSLAQLQMSQIEEEVQRARIWLKAALGKKS
jgi:hypothetical protein